MWGGAESIADLPVLICVAELWVCNQGKPQPGTQLLRCFLD